MNDEEKVYEVIRVTEWLCNICDKCHDDVVDRFRRGTRFPYFQRFRVTDDRRNVWTVLFYITSKEMKRKRAFYDMAYTVYEIPRKRKENDTNAGKGILFFDPMKMRDYMTGKSDKRPPAVYEIVPHAFNRYTERYLKPKGMGDIEFARKVENLMTRWQWFDVEADLYGDKNAEKHSNDGMCPYDIVMRGGGLLRGFISNGLVIRFNTYIDKDSMYDDQIERQGEVISEYYQMKREGFIE
jgi:hypothetical protein